MAFDGARKSEGDEELARSSSSQVSNEKLVSIDSNAERRLLWRIDIRLLPILMLIYLSSFLDRINVGNALTLGLTQDLHLRGDQVNTALAIFYVPYIIFEIPSNLLLKRVKPHIWLSACMFCYGIVVMCHGFVRNYGGFIAVRFFLGLAESGVFPGCSYLLTMWYKRDETLRRYAIFFNSVTLAGAFGGLLATAIYQMNGISGYAGWRWIFIIEGLGTLVVAVVAFFLIADFPENAKWLTEDERNIVLQRLRGDDKWRLETKSLSAGLKDTFSDYKAYCAALMWFGGNVPGYSISYFMPTIIKGYHYSSVETQLHAVAPFAAAWGFSILICFISARTNHRLGYILFSLAVAFAGVGILFNVHHDTRTQYAAIFLIAMGVFGALPIALCWYITNLHGHMDRAIGTAFMIGFGNSGGIVATFSFMSKDAPRYHTGYSIITMGLCITGAAAIAFAIGCTWENRTKRRRGDTNFQELKAY